MSEERIRKFEARRQELKKMGDDELKQRFWELCKKVVEPMTEYGSKYTSPSIERSVLLRMGIDSPTSQGAVVAINEAGLLGKGAGHVVLKVAKNLNLEIREAAKKISEDKTVLEGLF
ncbi:MAG: D-ornithine 4,5-aminomutase subunit alpha [Clostridiales bacterium]|jgi:D-ornithine 4,5-aminomutase subunit alpha|nr:D-ornithine 4,5-aminomutase subunit alpha [Clostridiales bacterium]MDN5282350.1 D-ornithine 4,5-aminomutase subunit alpha [Candidatus Ozemobacter sp.]